MVKWEPEFRVATVSGADPVILPKALDHAAPDVILLCQADPLDWSRTLEILKRIPAQEHVRMIVLRGDDNILEVYDKQCVELKHGTELITLIKYR